MPRTCSTDSKWDVMRGPLTKRSKGKPAKSHGLEFGEGVLWKRKRVANALGKLTSMWSDGIFLGVKGKSGAFVIGDGKGVWKTRTVQRKPVDERWSVANADLVKGAPWNNSPGDEKADGEMLEPAVLRTTGPEIPEQCDEEPVPRRAQIPTKRLGRSSG